MIFSKVNKTIGLLRRPHNILPRSLCCSPNKYKAFIRPHLDYSDIIYDQAYNATFHQKVDLMQYNACLAVMGAIRGTSKKKLYEGLVCSLISTVVHPKNYFIFINSTKMKFRSYIDTVMFFDVFDVV